MLFEFCCDVTGLQPSTARAPPFLRGSTTIGSRRAMASRSNVQVVVVVLGDQRNSSYLRFLELKQHTISYIMLPRSPVRSLYFSRGARDRTIQNRQQTSYSKPQKHPKKGNPTNNLLSNYAKILSHYLPCNYKFLLSTIEIYIIINLSSLQPQLSPRIAWCKICRERIGARTGGPEGFKCPFGRSESESAGRFWGFASWKTV